MAVEVVMPKLGMSMKEGTVSMWNKEVGDPVAQGEAIASVNSEKIEIDVESPTEGTLLKINVPEGEGVPPGTVICYIGSPDEEIHPESSPVQGDGREMESESPSITMTETILPAKAAPGRVRISPVARKMAEAANLDIEKIQGTGPGGRVTKEDVREAMKSSREDHQTQNPKEDTVSQGPAVEEVEQVPISGIRKVIAGRMHGSLQNSAQLTITMQADVTELFVLQKQSTETLEKRFGNKLTVTDFIARAVVLSLQQHPQMNAAYIDEKIYLYKNIHLGIAVAMEKGLVVPVVRNAERCSLLDLSKNIKSLAEKARQGQLANEDMQGSTFTVTSLGTYDVEYFTPILNPPESGILGVGRAVDLPIYIGEILERRRILPLSLTFDHRVLDGAPAAAFLQTIKRYLEEPITMLI